MSLAYPLSIGWLVQIVSSFYLTRSISSLITRSCLVLLPCALLTYLTGRDLPAFQTVSVLIVTFCWVLTIRLFHLVVLVPNATPKFYSFVGKLLWILCPIIPSPTEYRRTWPIYYDFLSAAIKVTINHWMYGWFSVCSGGDSYGRMLMFYTFLLTSSYIADVQSGIVRLVTGERYRLQSMNDFPPFSKSLREFWGRRYNRLIGTIFHQSIFEPILPYVSSKALASLLVFTLSGLLHVHLGWVTFKDGRSVVSSMLFFLVHGVMCCLESRWSLRLPSAFGYLYTQGFLLLTVALQIGPFTRMGSQYDTGVFPPFFDHNWIPKLPVPSFCPQ
jgi:hypothetical protein